MKQFNGKHGCCYCNREGEVRPGCPLHRFCPPSVGTLRIYASMIQNAKEATSTQKPVHNLYACFNAKCKLFSLQRSMVLKVQVLCACIDHSISQLAVFSTIYTPYTWEYHYFFLSYGLERKTGRKISAFILRHGLLCIFQKCGFIHKLR